MKNKVFRIVCTVLWIFILISSYIILVNNWMLSESNYEFTAKIYLPSEYTRVNSLPNLLNPDGSSISNSTINDEKYSELADAKHYVYIYSGFDTVHPFRSQPYLLIEKMAVLPDKDVPGNSRCFVNSKKIETKYLSFGKSYAIKDYKINNAENTIHIEAESDFNDFLGFVILVAFVIGTIWSSALIYEINFEKVVKWIDPDN